MVLVWTGWTYGQCHILWAMDVKVCSWVRILSSTLRGPSTMMVLGFWKMGFQGCWRCYGWLMLQMVIFLRLILRFCSRVSMWLFCQQMTRYCFFSGVCWCFYVGFAYLHFFFSNSSWIGIWHWIMFSDYIFFFPLSISNELCMWAWTWLMILKIEFIIFHIFIKDWLVSNEDLCKMVFFWVL